MLKPIEINESTQSNRSKSKPWIPPRVGGGTLDCDRLDLKESLIETENPRKVLVYGVYFVLKAENN